MEHSLRVSSWERCVRSWRLSECFHLLNIHKLSTKQKQQTELSYEVKKEVTCSQRGLGWWSPPGISFLSHHATVRNERETLFILVCGTNVLIPVETVEPTYRVINFSSRVLDDIGRADLDLLEEVRECVWIKSKALKWRLEMKHKSKVSPR